MLTRGHAIDLADAEIDCLANHVSNLANICSEGAMAEWSPGVEQLRAAVARVTTDIAASRAAKLQ